MSASVVFSLLIPFSVFMLVPSHIPQLRATPFQWISIPAAREVVDQCDVTATKRKKEVEPLTTSQ